jgi:hypothetical protein
MQNWRKNLENFGAQEIGQKKFGTENPKFGFNLPFQFLLNL